VNLGTDAVRAAQLPARLVADESLELRESMVWLELLAPAAVLARVQGLLLLLLFLLLLLHAKVLALQGATGAQSLEEYPFPLQQPRLKGVLVAWNLKVPSHGD
jgi:hypothetical protein